jgi:hypothetical protein
MLSMLLLAGLSPSAVLSSLENSNILLIASAIWLRMTADDLGFKKLSKNWVIMRLSIMYRCPSASAFTRSTSS